MRRERHEYMVPVPATEGRKVATIVLGLIPLFLGGVPNVGISWTIGIVLVVVGVILWLLGAVGRPVGGRAYWG
jgi:hypothetical protein